MKNLSKFLIAAAVIVCCFETACNKQEDSFMPVSGDNNSMSPLSLKSGAVFTVTPGGDIKDSKAIQKAFDDAVAAGPGSTVQLTKGTFVLDERIEVEGFVGCFKGAGKDKTIITTPLDKPVDFSLPDADWESLIKFRHGNINVSYFTIKISNPHPCTGLSHSDVWGYSFPCLIMLTGNSVKDGATINPVVSCTLNNVKFIGSKYNVIDDPEDYYNVAYCVNVTNDGYDPANWHDLTGNFEVTNCEFKTSFVDIFANYNGRCKIGGDNNSSGNKFEDAFYGVICDDCSNTVYDISNNCFKKIVNNGVILEQGIFGNPVSLSKFLIGGNYIEINKSGDGIALCDYEIANGNGKKLVANISDNQIYINDTERGGIWGCWAKDVLVKNNKFWGKCGLAGIYSSNLKGNPTDEMSGWVIKGNNVQGLNAQVAPIWLNSSSHDNTVIGSSLNTTVLDEGTNNVLINVNKKHWDHTPQEIHDKMMRIMK